MFLPFSRFVACFCVALCLVPLSLYAASDEAASVTRFDFQLVRVQGLPFIKYFEEQPYQAITVEVAVTGQPVEAVMSVCDKEATKVVGLSAGRYQVAVAKPEGKVADEVTVIIKPDPSQEHSTKEIPSESMPSVSAQVSIDGKLVKSAIKVEGPDQKRELCGSAWTKKLKLPVGQSCLTAYTPASRHPRDVTLTIDPVGVLKKASQKVPMPSAVTRDWEFYLIHHTHLDIGYTHVQEDVERLQMEHLDRALELIEKTRTYPEAAQFRWNPEGLWAVESYLKSATEQKRERFLAAVRSGHIGLDALYGNALTALYSGEELFALVDYAVRLREKYGLAIDSAMISDVPGLTWGMVPTLASSGVRYISSGTNHCHRIGRIRQLDDRPFWWVSPDRSQKVLYMQLSKGYSWFHNAMSGGGLTEKRFEDYIGELTQKNYPYAMVKIRYNIGADNGPPQPSLSDTVRAWNERYDSPKLIISTTSQMFHEFDRRYGKELPVLTGDITPAWEDGAASTVADTSACREATERLVQAQTLWTMLDRENYPADRFYAAWREAILYDEHTWGAYNSISEPDSDFARHQAERKGRFAQDARKMADALLAEAVSTRGAKVKADEPIKMVEVFNTESRARTDLVFLPNDWKLAGEQISDLQGRVVPSQRLHDGRLAFVAREVPPAGSALYVVKPGKTHAVGDAKAVAEPPHLQNSRVRLCVDPKTGAISELYLQGLQQNLVDTAKGQINEYVYVDGRDRTKQRRVANATIRVLDAGPLVATLEVTSDAPGAKGLVRQIRLVDGFDRIDLVNTIDKNAVRTPEGVFFAFPFHVPGGTVRIDVPWAVVRAEADQMDAACRNYLTVQRWVDVGSRDFGLRWATVDAPLIQLGHIRTDVRSEDKHDWSFDERIEPTQSLFSYVMNNYWETNYKADQSGKLVFRYSIEPYTGMYSPIRSERFGVDCCSPLVTVPANADEAKPIEPLVAVDNPNVLITSIKPSRDGRATMIRLFAAGGEPSKVQIGSRQGWKFYYSTPDEKRGEAVSGSVHMPAFGLTLLRAE